MEDPSIERGVDVIVNYLRHVLPGTAVNRAPGKMTITVERGKQAQALPLDPGKLAILGRTALDQSLPPEYKNRIIRDGTFGVLVVLGREGFAPDVTVWKTLLQENHDWDRNFILDTALDPATASKLREGLKALDACAAEMLQTPDVVVEELRHEREMIATVLGHFDASENFVRARLSADALSYLKAAALLWIIDLEKKNAQEPSQRIKIGRSKSLFAVAHQFWLMPPWDRTVLPPIIHDYISWRATAAKSAAPALGASLNIGPLLRKIDPQLEKRWLAAWETLRGDGDDKVSQAANSMVEVLTQVINKFRAGREFRDVVKERLAGQDKLATARLDLITVTKQALQSVKHETNPQVVADAEDLFHTAEGIIRTLLR